MKQTKAAKAKRLADVAVVKVALRQFLQPVPPGLPRTVADLVADVRSARARTGVRNPHRAVWEECERALTWMAALVAAQKDEIARLGSAKT